MKKTFLSKPVISGFTSAAVLIIGLNQIKHLVGADIPRSNQLHELALNIFNHIPDINSLTFMIGLISVTVILTLKKVAKKIPSALVVVILGILSAYFFNLDSNGVSIVETIQKGLPATSLPNLNLDLLQDLFTKAIRVNCYWLRKCNRFLL